jgi:hypothetical protein
MSTYSLIFHIHAAALLIVQVIKCLSNRAQSPVPEEQEEERRRRKMRRKKLIYKKKK